MQTAAGALEGFSLLKSRVISASILILFIIAIVAFNDLFPLALNLAVAAVSVMGVIEIVKALGLSSKVVLLTPSLVFAAAIPFLPGSWHTFAYYVYTVVIFASLILYHDSVTFRETGMIYSMTMLIPPRSVPCSRCGSSAGEHGMFYVIVAVFAAWISDAGRVHRRQPLGPPQALPLHQPEKDGGRPRRRLRAQCPGYGRVCLVYQWIYGWQVEVSYLSLALIGLVGAGLSVVGDLSFSLIKRTCHIKDFSNILPGHGGILDRFDSVIFVAPFVYFLVQILPITPV